VYAVAIVDDEKQLCDVYQRMLEQRGIPVCYVAYDGREAVEKFRDHSNPRPRIILMDYRLPTMNGIEAMLEILKIEPATRVIFLSADNDIEEEALRKGAVMFIQKPASIREIVGAVERVATRKDIRG
jgi:two-component system chemotaxis response regulator CheY